MAQLISFSVVGAESLPSAKNPAVQPYDLYDPRYCFLTPVPFLCKRCLSAGKRLARRLYFEKDGRPVRLYGCYIEKRERNR